MNKCVLLSLVWLVYLSGAASAQQPGAAQPTPAPGAPGQVQSPVPQATMVRLANPVAATAQPGVAQPTPAGPELQLPAPQVTRVRLVTPSAAPQASPPAPIQPPATVPATPRLPADCPEAFCNFPSVWFDAEYLRWWTRAGRLPPLATASPPGGNGTIGSSNTVVLFPGNDREAPKRSGGRFTLGTCFDDNNASGIEGSYFFLGEHTDNFTALGLGTPNTPVLARPFFNVNRGAEDSELVSAAGTLAGALRIHSSSQLEGAELNWLLNLCSEQGRLLRLFTGFRFLELNDRLAIAESLGVLPGVPSIGGTAFGVADSFDTANRFYGWQVGLRSETHSDCWFLEVTGKIALGGTAQSADIRGNTLITAANGASLLQNGGLLALPSNSGRHARGEFSVVPELGINLGYQFSPCVRAFVGYTFLYWSDVLRSGDQIDRNLNPTQLPRGTTAPALVGAASPAFTFRDTDFWAQGLNFGLEVRY